MSARIALISAILGLFAVLSPPCLMAQPKSDGDLPIPESFEEHKSTRSGEDHKKPVHPTAAEGKVLLGLGDQYRDRGQYARAVEYYEKALEIFRRIGEIGSERQALNNLGNVFWKWRRHEKAVEYYEKSLAICQMLADRKGVEETLSHLGHVHKDCGQYDKAESYYKKALDLSIELKGPRAAEKNFFMGLGDEYQALGQYAKAMEYYEKSLNLCVRLGNVQYEGYSLSELGLIYYKWGRYDKAVQYYENALERFRKADDLWGEMLILCKQGELYADVGQYDRAVEHLEKSLKLCLELRCGGPEARILMNLGNVQVHKREYEKALAYFEKSLAIFRNINASEDWPKKLIGDLYLDQGAVEKAEPVLKEAGHSDSLGRLHFLKSDYGSAREQYERLRQSAEASQDVRMFFTAYTGLGIVYESMEDHKNAEECFLKAVSLTEELRSNIPRPLRETFFDVKINGFPRMAPYDGLARARLKTNRARDAFKNSEYIKSRIFAESMSRWSESASFDIPADILKQDQELNDRLSALKQKLRKAYETGLPPLGDLYMLPAHIQEMEEKLQAHIKMLREKYPFFAATKYPEPIGLDQTSLKDSEWVLAYHVSDPGMIIYLTKGKEIVKALFKPIPRENLDNLVLTFRKPLEIIPGKDNFDDKLKSFDLAAGKKLSDLLLSDVLESLPLNVPLIIVPDASLRMLPFEMLVLNDKGTIKTDRDVPYISGAEFFGDRNLISYYESVTALSLSRMRAKGKKSGSRLLVIADPVYHEKDERSLKPPKTKSPTGGPQQLLKNLDLMGAENEGLVGGLQFHRLPLTGELAKSLSAIYGKDCDVYIGLDASKANFLENIAPNIQQYDKIVFAIHGYYGSDLPGIMEPVMILTLVPLGTDGYLRMTEIMSLNLNADIIVLAGSSTGLGKQIPGEGNMSMGKAFQYAGARSVLVSLWSVSDAASANLVKGFFQNMKDGKSKSEALRSARDEIRKKGFNHPFFWAAFILVGETN